MLDGDGAALMRLEAMTTIGHQRDTDLCHVLLDNEAYESTGSQPTVSAAVDFCADRRRMRLPPDGSTSRPATPVREAVRHAQEAGGTHLIRVRIAPGSDPGLGRPGLPPARVSGPVHGGGRPMSAGTYEQRKPWS